MQLDAYLLYAYADASGKQTKHDFMNEEDTWYRCFVRTVNENQHPVLASPKNRRSSRAVKASSSQKPSIPTVDLLCREFSPGKTISQPRRFKAVPQRFLRPANGAPCALNLDFEIWHDARCRRQFNSRFASSLWSEESPGSPTKVLAEKEEPLTQSEPNRPRSRRSSTVDSLGVPIAPSHQPAVASADDIRTAISAGIRQLNASVARQMERLIDALAIHEANQQRQLRQQQRQHEEFATAQRRAVEFGATPPAGATGTKDSIPAVVNGSLGFVGDNTLLTQRLANIEKTLNVLVSNSENGSSNTRVEQQSSSSVEEQPAPGEHSEVNSDGISALELKLNGVFAELNKVYTQVCSEFGRRSDVDQSASQKAVTPKVVAAPSAAGSRAPSQTEAEISNDADARVQEGSEPDAPSRDDELAVPSADETDKLQTLRESINGLALNAHVFFAELRKLQGNDPTP